MRGRTLCLLATILVWFPSASIAQEQNEKHPAFTLSIAITNYDKQSQVLSVDSATRYQSSSGDWRYTTTFGNNGLETIYRVGRGVYIGDSASGRLIKFSNHAAGCPAITAQQLFQDPKFVGTVSVLGLKAYILRERISSYVMETYFVPELRRIPFKRTYTFDDGHKMVEEPLNITMGEPAAADLSGPDYQLIEQIPVFNEKLSQQLVSQPPPVYPNSDRHRPVNIIVQVVVDVTGNVISARSTTPIPLFDVAAVNAAYQAVFSPTVVDGKAVVATGVLAYTFEPPGKPGQ